VLAFRFPGAARVIPKPGRSGEHGRALGRERGACPDRSETIVVVTGGQSIAANVVPARYTAGREVAVWFRGDCFAAADPMLGAAGEGGSLWSLLGDRLSDELDRPVLLINGAIGGTQFADWLDARSGYYAALLDRISTARRAGYPPQLVLWHQGETDAAVMRDAAQFEGQVTALMDRLAADLPEARVYLFQATRCIGKGRDEGVPLVNETLERVAETHARVLPGLDTDALGRDFRWDTCHFNSHGRDRIVEQVIPDLVRYLRTATAG